MKKSNITLIAALVVISLSSFISMMGVKKAFEHKVLLSGEAGLNLVPCNGFNKIELASSCKGNIKIVQGACALYLDDDYKEKLTYEVKNQTLYIDFSKLQDEEFNGRTVIHCPSLAGLRVGGPLGPKNDESTTYKTVIMSGFAQDTIDISIKDYVILELERNTIKYLKVASENKYVNQTNVELKPGNNISVADIALGNHNNLVLHTYVPELHLQMHDSATMYISGEVQKRMMHL
jgi:hypothetical protein